MGNMFYTNAKFVLRLVIFVSLPLCCTGCLAVAAAAAGAGTVAYVKGDLETNLDGTPQQVIKAAESAVNDQGLTLISSNSSELDGEVIARSGQDRKVTIKAKRLTDTSSRVSIRVGTFGDQSMSVAILERIKAHL